MTNQQAIQQVTNKYDLANYTAEHLTEMRHTLQSFSFADGELDMFDTLEFSDAQILAGIERHYDGGITQFMEDNLFND